jgi:hypothetical protein
LIREKGMPTGMPLNLLHIFYSLLSKSIINNLAVRWTLTYQINLVGL